MIYREINKEKGIYKFTFTGRHIYCYLHAISETSAYLDIINKIIIHYTNKELVQKYKEELTNHKKLEEIFLAINNMLTGKPIIYMEQILLEKPYGTGKLKWFNNLYLDQRSSNIMPPIPIEDIDTDLKDNLNLELDLESHCAY
jgi:hypothetical protein